VRLAIVKSVGDTYIDFQLIDQLSDQTFRAPIPHPYAGRGGGIFVGIERDSVILVANGIGEKWYCVATIPDPNFYSDLDGAANIKYDETTYPKLFEGEVAIKGNKGQYLDLRNNGNIRLDAGIGSSSSDIELSYATGTLFKRINQNYSFTEAGRHIEGIIRRDKRDEESEAYAKSTNFLDGEAYDFVLSDIGRFPQNEVQNRTTTLIRRTLRNPALIEKRNLTYEYGNSFNVQSFEDEVKAFKETDTPNVISDIAALQTDPSLRKNRRSDVLNLNSLNYNHLIEKIEGTVVDIYGNILDINRNIIQLPDIEFIQQTGTDKVGLGKVYDYSRRSVKLHYEINSRKPITDDEPSELDKTRNNARNFSRWSVDVDGEGLTKINIPASSETGNIPVLGRYFNSRDSDEENVENGSFKDENQIDIRLKQFGAKVGSTDNFSGVEIRNENYLPREVSGTSELEQVITTAGTAFHDIMNVANSILADGKFKNTGTSTSPVSEYVINKIADRYEVLDEQPNAGGRSFHANMDGSLEMSIGADTVDRKSIVLDTAGGMIAHLGRDKNGRSIVQQVDGDIIIQVGGNGIDDDTRFQTDSDTEDRPGRIEIHLNRSGGTPQKIIIDEDGLTFDIQQGMYFRSTGDMVFDCGATMLLQARQIHCYGTGDIDDRVVAGTETKVRRRGRG
jgi:hypothetical protein